MWASIRDILKGRHHMYTPAAMVLAFVLGMTAGAMSLYTMQRVAAVPVPTVSASPEPMWTTYPTPAKPLPSPGTDEVIPTGSPAASLPAAEDDPGWDCRVQGNHICMIRGERWLNLDHLPRDIYLRCLTLFDAGTVSPDGIAFDSGVMCKDVYGKRG